MTVITAGEVLRCAAAYLDKILKQPDLFHRVVSAARRRARSTDPATIQALSLLSRALDSPTPSSSPSPSSSSSSSNHSSSSLRVAEKLLLSLPRNTPFSAFLLAVTAAARRRTEESTIALLNIFILDPSASRNDLAPDVFEELFIPHLLPVIQNFADRRLRIMSKDHKEMTVDLDDERSIEAMAAMSLLSRMSGGQAEELKELEKLYEDILDVNTKSYAKYLMKIVVSNGGRETIQEPPPPQLILMRVNEGDEELGKVEEDEDEEVEGRIGFGSRNGRYNVIA